MAIKHSKYENLTVYLNIKSSLLKKFEMMQRVFHKKSIMGRLKILLNKKLYSKIKILRSYKTNYFLI